MGVLKSYSLNRLNEEDEKRQGKLLLAGKVLSFPFTGGMSGLFIRLHCDRHSRKTKAAFETYRSGSAFSTAPGSVFPRESSGSIVKYAGRGTCQ